MVIKSPAGKQRQQVVNTHTVPFNPIPVSMESTQLGFLFFMFERFTNGRRGSRSNRNGLK